MSTTVVITPTFNVDTFPSEAGPCCCGGGGGDACPDKCPVVTVTIDGATPVAYTGAADQYCKGGPIADSYPDEVADANGTIWYHLDDNNCVINAKRIYFWCGTSGTIYVLECPDDELTSTDLTEYPCDSDSITDLGGGQFRIRLQGCDENDLDIVWSNT